MTYTLENRLRTTCRDRPLEARKIILPDEMDRGTDICRQTYRLTNNELKRGFRRIQYLTKITRLVVTQGLE